MSKIGVLTIPDLTSYNPERITFGICSAIGTDNDVDIVGAESVSDRIADWFSIFSYLPRQRSSRPLQLLLLLPVTALNLLLYIHREKPDVLASFGNLGVNGFLVTTIGRLVSTPSVVRVTSDMFEIYRYQSSPFERLNTFVQNNVFGYIAVQLASRVIVLGPRTEDKLVNRGVASSKIHIIPQPPQTEEVPHPDSAFSVRAKHDIPADIPVILYVGRFSNEKGAERLIQTVNYVLNRSDDIHFLLVGAGGEKAKLVERALEGPRVHFAGHVKHEYIHYYYKAADIFLQPSNTEGLPNTVLESLYFNLPVVATDSGGEVITHVSNIGTDNRELGELLLRGGENLITDTLPDRATSQRNAELYRRLFSTIEV
ncbi:glycosyltransferase family 4 protein [Haloarcula brevis]|uniref:glycosyltransferase family 4 protein n=1 Tax=Haloarcula brevis TaxID=3111453 RepID=UPI00300EC44B